jgi:hypothetical protein
VSWPLVLVVAAYVAATAAAVVMAWRLDWRLDRWLLMVEARRALRGGGDGRRR